MSMFLHDPFFDLDDFDPMTQMLFEEDIGINSRGLKAKRRGNSSTDYFSWLEKTSIPSTHLGRDALAELLLEDIPDFATTSHTPQTSIIDELGFSFIDELFDNGAGDFTQRGQGKRKENSSAGALINDNDLALNFSDHDESVGFEALLGNSAGPRRSSNSEVSRGMRPRYMRNNYWGEIDTLPPTLAEWSETARPLPTPPRAELNNQVVLETLSKFPSLFKIITPIHVDVLETLLVNHPNREFVASVCTGLREGFWPFADTHPGEYPDIYDVQSRKPKDPGEAQFLRDQRDIEISKGRFSKSFGKNLHGGMYNSPTYAVPKSGSSDFRLVTDQSRGEYSLNSMIRHSDVAGMPMDDMQHFGKQLIAVHTKSPSRPLTLWKSDVTEAYRLCPMHPHWQIKQVITIDGERHIDRNNSFGGRGSFNLWGSVNSLVMWIAQNECHIDHPLCFNDDTFGVSDANDYDYYQPYDRMMPRDQCSLLRLWDILGIPHKEKKQLSGNPLTIIGVEVDANEMTMTLPADFRAKLVAELFRFTAQRNGSFSRTEFQKLMGWMDWAFNVFPLLRPSLSNVIVGISESASNLRAGLVCNDAMRNDLRWGLEHIISMDGIRILDCRAWSPSEAHLTIYTDACLESMGFWYPALKLGFWCDVPPNTPSPYIFYREALCVTSAFLDAISRLEFPSKIVIYTDNTNTVDIFNTLRAKPVYNHLLMAVADVMIAQRHRLKVLFIPGKDNTIADLLSRKKFGEARQIEPSITIKTFEPPRHLIRAVKL